MPLILLGLLLLIGLLAYSIVRYLNSGEEDTRPVRERYPKAFPPRNSDASEGPSNNTAASNASGETTADAEEEVTNAKGRVFKDSFRGDIDYKLSELKENTEEKIEEKLEQLRKFTSR